MLVIGVAALLLFGPKRLPELAKSLGKGIRDFKKALNNDEETPPPNANSTPDQLNQPGKTVSHEEKQKTEHKVD